MIPIDKSNDVINGKPDFRNRGKTIKKSSDGNTAQNIFEENSITGLISLVSAYNQTMAKMEINGSDAKTVATTVYRFEISATATTVNEVMINLSRYCIQRYNTYTRSNRRQQKFNLIEPDAPVC